MPPARGEGMTGSPIRLPCARETGPEDDNDPNRTNPKAAQAFSISLPLNSMRRTASPSRPRGRDAVGLRPSLDPDAYFDAPSQDKEARRTNQNNTAIGLDRPLSFRNEHTIQRSARIVQVMTPETGEV